jgi:serine O-acetyltransferase
MLKHLNADMERYRALLGTPGRGGGYSAFFHPRMLPVALCRLAGSLHRSGLSPLSKIISLVNLAIFGIEVSPRVDIGPGLFFPHTVGTVIGAARIGKNATIFQGVTLGAVRLDMAFRELERPVLGDDVLVGAGAKVLGGVRIGDGARIGANAVVLDDVPPGSLAVGIPARIVRESSAQD